MASRFDNSEFRKKVEEIMAQVPAGKVTTYGDLAALAGHPGAAGPASPSASSEHQSLTQAEHALYCDHSNYQTLNIVLTKNFSTPCIFPYFVDFAGKTHRAAANGSLRRTRQNPSKTGKNRTGDKLASRALNKGA